MKREEWQDLTSDVEWTLRYADREAVFPAWQSGAGKVPLEAWARWDEPYKISYAEYVATQREKDAGAYSVKGALERTKIFENADPGWKSVIKAHYGAIARGE